MDLTPGERTVLNQVRALYAIEARREHQIKALMMQWPPSHYATYQQAYAGLIAKLLLEDFGTQLFRLTEAGLDAIGVVRIPATAAEAAAGRGTKIRAGRAACERSRRRFLSRC